MKTVVRLPKPTGPTFSGADPTGTPRRHYHRRSHRGCQAGAANAWPKPNVVDRRADWEPPVRPVGRTAGQRTPIAGPAILGQSRDRHVTADHLTRRNARQRWRSSGANYGSQRPHIPLDPLRPLRDVPAGQWLFVRLPQTGSDPHALTGGQGVAGSNPAVPTRGHRQNCRSCTDRTLAVACSLVWRRVVTSVLPVVACSGERRGFAGGFWPAWSVADRPGEGD